MSRQPERIPRFFKTFDAIKYSNQLHIPSAYTAFMRGNLPKEAIFCDKFGNKWPIKLAKIESEWYFREGWAKVVQHNSLQHKDFVVFQFDGDKIFYIQIIGNGSCDKEGVGSFKYILESKEMEIYEMKGQAMPQKSELPGESSTKCCRGESDAAKVERKRKAKIDSYGGDIFKSGQLVQPRNPYFVAQIRLNRWKELYVPHIVIKDLNLTLPKSITLRDPIGRTWVSNLCSWKDGRTFYTGGWDSLCRVNLIGPEDMCVCEFVQGNGEQVIQVHIVQD